MSKHVFPGMIVAVFTILPLLLEMHGAPVTLRNVSDWLGWLGVGLLSGSLLLTVREPLIGELRRRGISGSHIHLEHFDQPPDGHCDT